MPKSPRDEFRSFLSIDKDSLDECLMEQPEIYEKVAEAVAVSEGERDKVQLDFDELLAELDQSLRVKASKEEGKEGKTKRITDKALEQELKTLPKVKELHRKLLDKKREAKLWRALEKAFEQRKDMLSKLVDLHIRQTYGYVLASGANQARNALVSVEAERNREAANILRRKRL